MLALAALGAGAISCIRRQRQDFDSEDDLEAALNVIPTPLRVVGGGTGFGTFAASDTNTSENDTNNTADNSDNNARYDSSAYYNTDAYADAPAPRTIDNGTNENRRGYSSRKSRFNGSRNYTVTNNEY